MPFSTIRFRGGGRATTASPSTTQSNETEGTRTSNLRIDNPALWPFELRPQQKSRPTPHGIGRLFFAVWLGSNRAAPPADPSDRKTTRN